MRKLLILLLAVMLIATLSPAAFATNGTQLIGIGPISRSMGGVGIAAPQDAISAVFANPAGMCFGPYCPSSQFDFAGTIFMPEQKAEVQASGQSVKAESRDQDYAIPAIGFSVPIGEADTRWRFGLSAYGVSGLGVDYRDTNIDQTVGGAPLATGTYTNLQLMKFAPTIAYQALPNLSVGTSFQINYSTLDLGEGNTAAYSYGVQLGVLYKPLDQLSLGLTYTSPQEAKYKHVANLDQSTPDNEDLKLEQPQQVGLGVAYEFLKPRLLLETNVKWINWSDAKGFEDFDWNDQWVFAVGGQWEAIDHLFFRVGYNYAESPVDDHDGWDGSFSPGPPPFPNDVVNVQGSNIPRYYYETFRVIGFPALVEHHIAAGIGYEVGESLVLNLSYMHAFENSLTENGTGPDGNDARIKSKLYEDSLSCAFTWRF